MVGGKWWNYICFYGFVRGVLKNVVKFWVSICIDCKDEKLKEIFEIFKNNIGYLIRIEKLIN